MQIQRIQSLWLFLAAVGAALAFILSIDAVTIPAIVAAMMSLAAIFLYRNMRLQTTLAWTSTFLLIVSVALVGIAVMQPQGTGVIGTIIAQETLMLAGVVFNLLAIKGIRSDKRLLESYDRLR